MATSFPGAIDSYTVKADNVDTVQAAHVNNLQDAVVAVQTVIGAGASSGFGSWVPTFAGTTTNPTVTYAVQDGRYQRLGSIVFFSGHIQLSAASGGSGNLVIASLPFLSGNANGPRGSVVVGYSNGFATLSPFAGVVSQNNTLIALFGYGSADARTSQNTWLTTANLSATVSLFFSGFYFVA